MIAKGVLYPRLDFEYVVSGVNRGDNAGLHVIYSGTVAGAREGAMRGNAVGVAVSLNSYSRSADYSEVGLILFVHGIIIACALRMAASDRRVQHSFPCNERWICEHTSRSNARTEWRGTLY